MQYRQIKLLVILAILICAGTGFISAVKHNNEIKPGTQEDKGPDYPCFLALSDIHLCDDCRQAQISNEDANSGSDLWAAAVTKLQQVLSGAGKPKFIILLGDLPRHKADAQTKKRVIGTALHDVRELAQNANIPLIYVPGNNDGPDENYGLFSESIYADDVQCKKCWPFIETQAGMAMDAPRIVAGSKSEAGYYSCYPTGKGLRVIVMNTVIFTHKYFKIDGDEPVLAARELKWLDAQLSQAKAAEEKVLIVMHVPPGVDYQGKPMWQEVALPDFNNATIKDAFLHIIETRSDIITGLLSSHTHLDGIKIFYNDKGRPFEAGISIPGIAAGHGNYPSFNQIYYQASDFELQDFKTCYYPYENGETPGNWGYGHFYFSNLTGNIPGKSLRERLINLENADTVKTNAIADSIYMLDNQASHKHDHDRTVAVRY